VEGVIKAWLEGGVGVEGEMEKKGFTVGVWN
jgi:hypothetical protein